MGGQLGSLDFPFLQESWRDVFVGGTALGMGPGGGGLSRDRDPSSCPPDIFAGDMMCPVNTTQVC